MILPVNVGYYNTKSLDDQMFKSRIGSTEVDNISCSADILQFNNEYYVVGEGQINIDVNKTTNDFNRILVLNMLSRFMSSKETFKLALTAPPLTFKAQRKALPQYLIGEYTVLHNGEKKIIKIEDCKVFPEGLAAYIENDIGQYQNKQVLVIDIGGFTTNLIRIVNGSFTIDDLDTIPSGMYHIDTEITRKLLKDHYKACNVDDIYFGRINGIFNDNQEDLMSIEKEYINSLYDNHVKAILDKCSLLKWDVRSYETLVTGGGGEIQFDNIQKRLPKALLSKNPIFDNVLGLDKLAKMVYLK